MPHAFCPMFSFPTLPPSFHGNFPPVLLVPTYNALHISTIVLVVYAGAEILRGNCMFWNKLEQIYYFSSTCVYFLFSDFIFPFLNMNTLFVVV